MSILDRIKSYLFKNKHDLKQIESSSSTLAQIDAGSYPLPKYKELDEEDKRKVVEFYSEINQEQYDTIVQYGKNLYERANINTAVFMHLLKRLAGKEDKSHISDEEKKKNIVSRVLDAKINKEEFATCLRDFYNLKKEAILRAVALERHMKQQKKYNFLGLFGKAEKLKHIQDRRSLENAMSCIIIAIRNIDHQSLIVKNTMIADADLIRSASTFSRYAIDDELFISSIELKFKEVYPTCERLLGDSFSDKKFEFFYNLLNRP